MAKITWKEMQEEMREGLPQPKQLELPDAVKASLGGYSSLTLGGTIYCSSVSPWAISGPSSGLGSAGTHTAPIPIVEVLPTQPSPPPIAPYKRPAYLLWNLLKPVPRLLVDRLSNGKRSTKPTP